MDASKADGNLCRFLVALRELCQKNDPNWDSKTQEQETFSVVYQVYEALGQGNVEGMTTLMSEDAEFLWHGGVTHPFVSHVVGRASVMQKVTINFKLLQDQDTTLKYVAVQGSTLCIGMYETGIFCPTGNRYYAAGMMVFVVENQKVRRSEWFGDFDSALLRQPGAK